MKILHITPSLNPVTGGPARSVPELALAQARLGHEVRLWSADGWNGSDLVLERLDARVEHMKGGLRNAISGFGFIDVVHDHGLWLPFHRQAAVECRHRNIPRVVSPRGMLEPWALNHKKWKKRLAWWLYQRRDLFSAAALHATAASEAEQCKKLGFRNPILVVPNGVNLPPAVTPTPRPIHGDTRTMLFLSRVHPKKGLPLLLEAWAGMPRDGWRLRIVGPDEGGHGGELRKLCEKLGLSWQDARSQLDHVDCTGAAVYFTDSVEGETKERFFREADLFVLPTYSENFGIAVAEALASGVPVITTTGAPWEGLHDKHCGWWVSPEVGALRGALKEAVGLSPEGRAQMGQRGAGWMDADFGWKGIAEKMIGGYQQVLSSARGIGGNTHES
jgi:glycosyltransferase involved in cell wall biosynthesis